MTTQPDLDQALGAWLRDVPPHSDRARVAVLAQLGTTRQHRPRPSWLLRSPRGRSAPHAQGGPACLRDASHWPWSHWSRSAQAPSTSPPGRVPSPVPTTPVATPSPVPSAPVATTSPTPARSTKPLSGLLASLVTEEVEPGVLRVMSDGYRDVSLDLYSPPVTRDSSRLSNVVAGPDGSVWLFGADEWYRLGEGATYPVTDETPNGHSQMAQVAPDGTLWTVVESDDNTSALVSFQDGSWTVRQDRVGTFDLETDGTVWVTTGSRFVRLRDGWRTPEFGGADDVGAFWVSPVTPATKADGDEVEVVVLSVATCPACSLSRWGLQEGGDTHGDGAGELPVAIDAVDMDPRGDLWVYQHLGDDDFDPEGFRTHYLVQVTGDSMTVHTDSEGVPEIHVARGSLFRAAPDGGVWLTPRDESGSGSCDGLAHFDGSTWTHYLPGRCVFAFDITPDGTVWLQAEAQGIAYPIEPDEAEKTETLVIPG